MMLRQPYATMPIPRQLQPMVTQQPHIAVNDDAPMIPDDVDDPMISYDYDRMILSCDDAGSITNDAVCTAPCEATAVAPGIVL